MTKNFVIFMAILIPATLMLSYIHSHKLNSLDGQTNKNTSNIKSSSDYNILKMHIKISSNGTWSKVNTSYINDDKVYNDTFSINTSNITKIEEEISRRANIKWMHK